MKANIESFKILKIDYTVSKKAVKFGNSETKTRVFAISENCFDI